MGQSPSRPVRTHHEHRVRNVKNSLAIIHAVACMKDYAEAHTYYTEAALPGRVCIPGDDLYNYTEKVTEALTEDLGYFFWISLTDRIIDETETTLDKQLKEWFNELIQIRYETKDWPTTEELRDLIEERKSQLEVEHSVYVSIRLAQLARENEYFDYLTNGYIKGDLADSGRRLYADVVRKIRDDLNLGNKVVGFMELNSFISKGVWRERARQVIKQCVLSELYVKPVKFCTELMQFECPEYDPDLMARRRAHAAKQRSYREGRIRPDDIEYPTDIVELVVPEEAFSPKPMAQETIVASQLPADQTKIKDHARATVDDRAEVLERICEDDASDHSSCTASVGQVEAANSLMDLANGPFRVQEHGIIEDKEQSAKTLPDDGANRSDTENFTHFDGSDAANNATRVNSPKIDGVHLVDENGLPVPADTTPTLLESDSIAILLENGSITRDEQVRQDDDGENTESPTIQTTSTFSQKLDAIRDLKDVGPTPNSATEQVRQNDGNEANDPNSQNKSTVWKNVEVIESFLNRVSPRSLMYNNDVAILERIEDVILSERTDEPPVVTIQMHGNGSRLRMKRNTDEEVHQYDRAEALQALVTKPMNGNGNQPSRRNLGPGPHHPHVVLHIYGDGTCISANTKFWLQSKGDLVVLDKNNTPVYRDDSTIVNDMVSFEEAPQVERNKRNDAEGIRHAVKTVPCSQGNGWGLVKFDENSGR